MPTPQELAMAAQYGGNDFQNQDWASIYKALQNFSPDQYDGRQGIKGPDGIGGWYMDSYQPGGDAVQLQRRATNQDGVNGDQGRYDTVLYDPAKNSVSQSWQQYNPEVDNWMSYLAPFAALTGAGLALGPMLGGTAAGEGAGAAASGFSIPTSEELAAAGFGDGTGMGMTGAGGIGSASSVAGAGAGAAGYGTTAAELGTAYGGEFGADQGQNEWQKLLNQQTAADNGTSLLQTGVPFTDLSSVVPNGITDALKSAITPSNIAKIAAALKGTGGGNGGASGGMGLGGGSNGVFNQVANETPGMIAGTAQQPQTQQLAQALLLGDPAQQKFNPLQFNPVQLAQALQDA